MKRFIAVLALCMSACGGGNVAVALVPEGTADVSPLGSSSAGLSDSTRTRAVRLTIDEVSVHVAGVGSGDEGNDDSKHPEDRWAKQQEQEQEKQKRGWQVISTEEREVDLLAVSIEEGELLGDIELPAGKITQLRLRLKSTGDRHGQRVLEDAVVEANGSTCDLLVPESAFNPGLKLTGVFKELDVDPEKRRTLLVSFGLKDANRFEDGDGCGWRLAPVLKLHEVRE